MLGPTGFNLGSGMTGGAVYLLDGDPAMLNAQYVKADALSVEDAPALRALLEEHALETESPVAAALLADFDPSRFVKVTTRVQPEAIG